LLRVLQVKQCENKNKQNLQCYLTKRKYHTREPRIYQENTIEHQEILQSFTLLLQERLPKITRENWRERESVGRDFGIIELL
jgi:hypothetical protein